MIIFNMVLVLVLPSCRDASVRVQWCRYTNHVFGRYTELIALAIHQTINGKLVYITS